MNVYILAGGKSSRMGEDKGLKALNGRPMVSYVIDQARILSLDIYIITSNKKYAQFGYPLIEDVVPDLGPAGGILTGLEHSNKGRNLFLSSDMPLLGIFEIGFVANWEENEIVCYEDEEYLYPFPGLYSKHLYQDWKDLLEVGVRKTQNLIRKFDYKAKVVENRKLYLNVNTPKDFQEASKHLP